MLPLDFSNGDRARRLGHGLILEFAGPRRVLSTAAWNGGLREDLRAVFNYDLSHGKTRLAQMLAPTYAAHMRLLGEELGLPAESCGLCTAAQLDNMAVAAEHWAGVTVTALVTAGIDENGGRAGDPASWQEQDGVLGLPVGTINLILHLDCALPEGVLTTALLTATEAKCAAIQELRLPSLYSTGLATGSGTDGAILVAQPDGAVQRTDAGKHSKLGEQIGRAVLRAVKGALFRQSGASPRRLRDARRHLGRYGITGDALLALAERGGTPLSPWALYEGCRREEVWTAAALCAHLLDLTAWGILTEGETRRLLRRPLPQLRSDLSLQEALAHWLIQQSNQSEVVK